MTDSLGDLLLNKSFDEPPEIQIIKEFVKEKYNVEPIVSVRQRDILIEVSSAALAGTLRMQLHKLQALCQTEKRLVIRIIG
jgi:hypothetical protein